MTDKVHEVLMAHSLNEPLAKLLNIQTIQVGEGSATTRMVVASEHCNIYGVTHGGVLFSLIDEAFQLACNSHGSIAVALNVSITYVAPPDLGATIEAEAVEVYKTRKTASYSCKIRQMDNGKLIATANGLAYRTGKPLAIE